MIPHINNLCKLLYYELRRIGQLSKYLNTDSVKTLVSSFIFSRLDYCNSLIINLPDSLLKKLQRLQNQAARLVLKKRKSECVETMMLTLHWLPIEYRIIYKVAVLCYKYFNDRTPMYISDLISPYSPTRSLRSSDKFLLNAPKKGSKTFGDRSFVHAAPATWNSLPLDLRGLVNRSETSFKTQLKTFLMRSYLS